MRTPGEVAQKLKQVRYRHLKKELKRLLKQTARTCKHNTLVETRGGESGICTLDCKACDTWLDRSSDCGKWEPRHTAEEIKESLKEFFKTRPVHEVAVRFPDVAALLWMLADEDDPQAGPLIPNAVPTTTLYGIELWVDTREELEILEDLAKEYERDRKVVEELEGVLKTEPSHLVKSVQDLLTYKNAAMEEADEFREEFKKAEKKIAELEKNEALREEVVVAPSGWRRWVPWLS